MTFIEYVAPLTTALANLCKTADGWDVPPTYPPLEWTSWAEWESVCKGDLITDQYGNSTDGTVIHFGVICGLGSLVHVSHEHGLRYQDLRARHEANPDDNQWLADFVASQIATVDPATIKTRAESIRRSLMAGTLQWRRRGQSGWRISHLGHNAG